jgi:hypothetical protein
MDDWELAYSIKTGRPYDFEQAVHSKLAHIRNRSDREFFELPLSPECHPTGLPDCQAKKLHTY